MHQCHYQPFERCSGFQRPAAFFHSPPSSKTGTFRDIEVHDSTMPLSTGFERCSGSGQEVSLTAACPRSERVVFTATDESDTPRKAGGLMSWTASKAVGYWFRRRAEARL